MKFCFRYIGLSITALLVSALVIGQEKVVRELDYDPDKLKIIPDKVFEIGLPLLFLYLVANTILTIFRIKAENRLKEKAFDKGLSEQTLLTLFAQDKKMERLLYLKWFLVLAALGISLIYIHLLAEFVHIRSGYLALGMITLMVSLAFLIYYRILRKQ